MYNWSIKRAALDKKKSKEAQNVLKFNSWVIIIGSKVNKVKQNIDYLNKQ